MPGTPHTIRTPTAHDVPYSQWREFAINSEGFYDNYGMRLHAVDRRSRTYRSPKELIVVAFVVGALAYMMLAGGRR
jgi:hypothetical protein